MMKKGFTLVELLSVLAIIGIGAGLFYSTLLINWSSFENRQVMMDLQMDADSILESMVTDGRLSSGFSVAGNGKTVTFSYPVAAAISYALVSPNILQRSGGNGSSAMSDLVNVSQSNFTRSGNLLSINLQMVGDALGRPVVLNASTDIAPRNIP